VPRENPRQLGITSLRHAARKTPRTGKKKESGSSGRLRGTDYIHGTRCVTAALQPALIGFVVHVQWGVSRGTWRAVDSSAATRFVLVPNRGTTGWFMGSWMIA